MIKVDLGKQRACLSPCTRTKPDCHAFARKDEQNTERFSSLATKKRVGTQKNISHPYGKIRADFIMLRQVYGKTQVTSKVYPSSPLHGSSPRPSGLARKQAHLLAKTSKTRSDFYRSLRNNGWERKRTYPTPTARSGQTSLCSGSPYKKRAGAIFIAP